MKKSVSIIGGGSSALFIASFLDSEKFDISIYEKNKTLGRKFLVAGKGGFNLTHSEPIGQMIERYTPVSFLKKALLDFDNSNFRDWLDTIGIPTFVGSSKRVYPKEGIKPIEVLNAILKVLKEHHVSINYEHNWNGWNEENDLIFNSDVIVKSEITIFSMGGGSWKITGSDGDWLELFTPKGVSTLPFQPSNCAFGIHWNSTFLSQHEGTPLKNISISCGDKTQKGEVVITQFGLEGNAIYALSPQIREGLNTQQKATIHIDLKPNMSEDNILQKIRKSRLQNYSQIIKKELKLSPAQIALIKVYVSKEDFMNINSLVRNIKKLPVEISGISKLDTAISTVGGIDIKAIDNNFEIHQLKNHYCIGEMLNWDAPTGGYLLQVCASMSVYLARHLNTTH